MQRCAPANLDRLAAARRARRPGYRGRGHAAPRSTKSLHDGAPDAASDTGDDHGLFVESDFHGETSRYSAACVARWARSCGNSSMRRLIDQGDFAAITLALLCRKCGDGLENAVLQIEPPMYWLLEQQFGELAIVVFGPNGFMGRAIGCHSRRTPHQSCRGVPRLRAQLRGGGGIAAYPLVLGPADHDAVIPSRSCRSTRSRATTSRATAAGSRSSGSPQPPAPPEAIERHRLDRS